MAEKIPSMVVQFLKKQKTAHVRIADLAGISQAYVSMALSGKKTFSERFIGAVMIYLLETIRDLQYSLTYLQSEEYRKRSQMQDTEEPQKVSK